MFRQPLAQRHGSATGRRHIRVTASKNSKELVLRFIDSGPGVAPEHRAELFEFGKTTKIGGSGIGLPLSQLIVESHGGTLVYEDQNGAAQEPAFV